MILVNGAHAEFQTVADGSSSASTKRAGWIASLFGSSSKPSTSSNSSQESEETSETDGGVKKDEQTKKEEHITVPAKGMVVYIFEDVQIARAAVFFPVNFILVDISSYWFLFLSKFKITSSRY